MKELSPITVSKEAFIHINYLICRFKTSKTCFAIKENQSVLFTIKQIKESKYSDEFHFHIRFSGKNFKDKNTAAEDIDFDFYVEKKEFLEKWSDFVKDA